MATAKTAKTAEKAAKPEASEAVEKTAKPAAPKKADKPVKKAEPSAEKAKQPPAEKPAPKAAKPAAKPAKKKKELMYKGHPLMRKDNLIYYGSMSQKYIIMMQVLETAAKEDIEVATKVSVQLQLTDPDLKSKDRVVKKAEKVGLYNAMDVAVIWLERALAGK